ncbi:MAG: peptidase M20 [Bacteroidetes bacterium GWF2_49_14]|nr:MAG: peptidase M20 [Bacteroidetes bacterium GWF2_49_14]HBB93673.1 dipeptidase [Bacteroidales bacterium]
MITINEYIDQHKERFLEELFGLIRIPSISSIASHKPDMYRAAASLKKLLLQAGVDSAEIYETEGNPVIYAQKMVNPDWPTVMVYAHMDVMPVDPLDLWKSDPFDPVIREDKIFARGADDDKGQSFMHIKAFEYLAKTGQLRCNVKFMIEGEEEIGSPNLGKFCEEHKEMLKSDIILVSDTSMIGQDTPSITTGLRGLTYLQIEVTGPDKDLHSGLFGGAVANPIVILSKMLATVHDENNRITIPGFYDDVLEATDEERALLSQAPFNEEKYRAAVGVDEVWGEKGYRVTERTGIRPTFEVCGIWGGYTGEGTKTVLPSKAFAKISSRIVPHQDHHKIARLIQEYFESIAPPQVKVKVENLHGGAAYVSPITMPAYKAAEKAYAETFGKRPVPFRSGGSIPIISTFENVLGVKSILMGFGLESDAIHSPNENFPLWNLYKGIETITRFYHYYTE